MHNNNGRQFDVIVVGGGPSGLHTTSFLSDSGLSVALFDERSEIGENVVCSGVVSKEAFSRYDLPPESILGKLKDAELFSPGGIRIPYSHPDTAAVVVDRHVFDGKLGEIARKKGAEIYLNTRVSSLQVGEKFVEAALKTQEGEKTVRAQVAVIATGVSFVLHSPLGLGRPKNILKGIQVEIDGENLNRLRIYFGSRFSRGFFGWAIPLMNGKTRVGVMTKGNALEGLKNVLSELGHNPDSCADTGVVKRRGIAFGNVSKSYSDRIIAVGEAAGHIKTTTGGGIYYGLVSAEIASDVISKAFKKGGNNDNFHANNFSEYERLWKKSLGKETAFGEYFHKFYSNLDDNSIDNLFYAAEQDGLLSYIASRGRFDWHKGAVIKILRSPNLRKILWNGLINGLPMY